MFSVAIFSHILNIFFDYLICTLLFYEKEDIIDCFHLGGIVFPGVNFVLGGCMRWLLYAYASIFQLQNAVLSALAVLASLMFRGSEFQIRML